MTSLTRNPSRRFVALLGALMSTGAFSVETSLPALPLIAAALEVGAREAQLVITFTVIGLTIGQIPVGLAADRYGRVRVITVCLTLYGCASLVAAFSRSLELVLAARLLLGIGACCGTVVARAIVRDVATQSRAAQLMSALFAILAGAMLLAPLLGSALVALSGWRLVFVGIGAYGFIVLFAVIKSLPETGNRNADGRRLGQQFSDSTRAFLATPQSLVATAIFAIAFCGFFAFVTNSSTVASDVFGIAPGWFGPLYAAVALSYLLGSTLSRYCVARLGSRTMLRAAASVLAATGVALLAASRPDVVPLTLLWSLVMLYAFAFGIVTPTTTSLALEPLPTVAGFASSIIGTVQSAAGAAMSAVAAWLYAGSTQSLTLLMGCAGVATGAIYLLGRGTLSHGEGKLHG